jgi:hypothetical protein
MPPDRALRTIRVLHTAAWAFFVACIVGMPILAWQGRFLGAAVLAGLVVLEGVVLLVNRWRCPLTIVAERFTDEHPDGFDIYIPPWLARHNKVIFTSIWVAGLVFSIALWLRR